MKIQGLKFSNLKTKPKILLGVCSPMVLLLILGGVSIYSISSIVDDNKWVDHTRVVLADSASIIGSAVDMETVAVEDMGANVGAEDIRMWVRYVVEAPVGNNLAFR